jgi:hypothetical protein
MGSGSTKWASVVGWRGEGRGADDEEADACAEGGAFRERHEQSAAAPRMSCLLRIN